mgnify:FL=1
MKRHLAALACILLAAPAAAQPFILPLSPQRKEEPPPPPSPVPVAPPQAEPSPQPSTQPEATAPAPSTDIAGPAR